MLASAVASFKRTNPLLGSLFSLVFAVLAPAEFISAVEAISRMFDGTTKRMSALGVGHGPSSTEMTCA
jgi:hypothetical protein